METIIERIDGDYFICTRQDGIIIDIPIKFLKSVNIGDVIIIPVKRNLN